MCGLQQFPLTQFVTTLFNESSTFNELHKDVVIVLPSGTCIIDIKVSLNEILLLFNSSTERAIHSFDHSGIFLREVIGNHRGLHNPLNFCVNSDGVIFIADGKIKVFNTFRRQIDSFGEELEDWAKCVLLDATTSRILVLADLNGKCHMHIHQVHDL